jgi:hypothetical protein
MPIPYANLRVTVELQGEMTNESVSDQSDAE